MVFAFAVLVVVVLVVGFSVTLPYYALSPGSATAVNGLITVPAGKAHPVQGSFYLVDVSISPVRVIDWIPDELSPDTKMVSSGALLGPTPPGQYVSSNLLVMDVAKKAAEVVALRRLGYSVTEHDAGVQMLAVLSGSPASSKLRVGDTITSVGTTPTPATAALVTALAAHRPGQTVNLTVEPAAGGPSRSIPVTLGFDTGSGARARCAVASSPPPAGAKACIGVAPETRADFGLPFPVKIDSGNIGGPSAGLAFTLGLIDTLSNGNLTGGHKVAATGTMDLQGDVGPIGGVAQKTVAVESAGARVFLVPAQNAATARAHAGSRFRIIAVSSLAQALAALHRLGGDTSALPPPPSHLAPPGASAGV